MIAWLMQPEVYEPILFVLGIIGVFIFIFMIISCAVMESIDPDFGKGLIAANMQWRATPTTRLTRS